MPSRRRPRAAVQMPSTAATMPTTIGHVIVRDSIGGMARNAANDAEHQARVAARRRVAQARAQRVLEPLRPLGHAAASVVRAFARGRSFRRVFQM